MNGKISTLKTFEWCALNVKFVKKYEMKNRFVYEMFTTLKWNHFPPNNSSGFE